MMKASTKFPDWTQDEAIAYESACETITHVIGICTAMIEEERVMVIPNMQKITKLNAEIKRLNDERSALDLRNHVKINQIRTEYSARVRAYNAGTPVSF